MPKCIKFVIVMRFLVTITAKEGNVLPINYQYPLSAAIYKIISKGDSAYADFLHGKGYGNKGLKMFTFSQLQVPFKIEGDRLRLTKSEAQFQVAFHLPEAMENFVKGLFQSEALVIADKKSKVAFAVQSVESVVNPLQHYKENELINIKVRPNSPIVAGLMKENGKYDFLEPTDPRFTESLIYNWRTKIETCYDKTTATQAILLLKVIPMQQPPKSRLIGIKADTDATTKIRGWMNFELKITGEKKFVELLLNSGIGIYNAQGMGSVEVVEKKKNNIKVKLKKYDNI
jgi:CRISPR-associated endoribonuclease Cas6